MDPGLWRKLDASGCEREVRALDDVELILNRGEEAADFVSRQVEQRHIS
jgi:hypothetical protein